MKGKNAALDVDRDGWKIVVSKETYRRNKHRAPSAALRVRKSIAASPKGSDVSSQQRQGESASDQDFVSRRQESTSKDAFATTPSVGAPCAKKEDLEVATINCDEVETRISAAAQATSAGIQFVEQQHRFAEYQSHFATVTTRTVASEDQEGVTIGSSMRAPELGLETPGGSTKQTEDVSSGSASEGIISDGMGITAARNDNLPDPDGNDSSHVPAGQDLTGAPLLDATISECTQFMATVDKQLVRNKKLEGADLVGHTIILGCDCIVCRKRLGQPCPMWGPDADGRVYGFRYADVSDPPYRRLVVAFDVPVPKGPLVESCNGRGYYRYENRSRRGRRFRRPCHRQLYDYGLNRHYFSEDEYERRSSTEHESTLPSDTASVGERECPTFPTSNFSLKAHANREEDGDIAAETSPHGNDYTVLASDLHDPGADQQS